MHPRKYAISYSRIIHLSHIIRPGIPVWPKDPQVEMETIAEIPTHGYYLRRLSIGEHSATHMNAPASFHTDAASIESYTADSLVVPGVVIYPSDAADDVPDRSLSIADVRDWESINGPVPQGSLALAHTGWDRRWNDPEAYLNIGPFGAPRFPGIEVEAAQFLLESRGAAGLGIDSPGVDPGHDGSYGTNRLALSRQRIVLENLTNLEQLPATGATLVIGILRLAGGSGSPASALAFLP